MNNLIKSLLACAVATGIVSPASAIMIGLNPSVQSTTVGGQASYDIVVGGLGGVQLGAFDVRIDFNSLIAETESVSFGTKFGLSFQDFFLGSGRINLSEVAFGAVSQPNEFVLGTFTLKGVTTGTTTLTINPAFTSLSDENAVSLDFTTSNGALHVPDASNTAGLLGLGLLSIGALHSRLVKRTS